jgi:DnaJ-class molecular chaperone
MSVPIEPLDHSPDCCCGHPDCPGVYLKDDATPEPTDRQCPTCHGNGVEVIDRIDWYAITEHCNVCGGTGRVS